MTEAQTVDVQAEAESEGDDARASAREFAIIVNGRGKVVHEKVLTFDEIVRLAFKAVPAGPDVTFTVTYSRAVKPQHEGVLSPGGKVTIKQGTIFDVTRTNKS
ncbi:multiubiquitin domain-containing protein [Actinoplanes sp. NPDC051859]|uniref:multiubiquitin domain-containing protein n=1 Tax=Actinoplanes sp. NPDC051859 TaxID=3363909 RepID=UPI0037AF7B9E